MGSIKCVEINRDKNGTPLSYTLFNEDKKEYKMINKEELKLKMKKDFKVDNLILTSDYKIREVSTKASEIVLYHGSPNKIINLEYGRGEDKHDYGRGFYLTPNIDLAKEWAVCTTENNGFLHYYSLDISDLKVLDFDKLGVLSWIAELMSHRDAADSVRYKKLAPLFIEKYKVDTTGYDIIKGWRADSSYFYIAKQFVNDNVDVEVLEELLHLGDLGVQYCLKSEKAFKKIKEDIGKLSVVEASIYKSKYNERDLKARDAMRKLVESDKNLCLNTFSTLLKG